MRITLPGTILPSSTTGTSLIAPTARIAASGGLMIAVNSSTPNIPRFEMEKVAPLRSPSPGRPDLARSMTWRDSMEIWIRSLMSASCTTGTSRPMPWLGATASPMLTARLRWNLPSTHELLTSGNLRSASAQARTRKSVIVTFSAPATESFSCWRRLTARSTRASTVTWNSGTVDFDSAIRRAMVACIRVGSTTSTSGPAALSVVGIGRRRSDFGREPPAAITSSLTMRPSGPLPFSEARSTPISSAIRRARGEALISRPSCCPSWVCCLAGAGFSFGASGGGADFWAGVGFSAEVGGVSGSLRVGFWGGASAPASPMRAMGAPILAGTPWSTRICSTPSASASRSNVALSDSTSASPSPVLTSSPLFFFHSTIVPSSIVSESFGMFTSGIGTFPEGAAHEALDVLTGRDRRLLQRQAVGHRDLGAAQAPDRRVEVVKAPLLYAGRDLGRDAVRRPALFDHHAAARLAHLIDDRLPVDGPDRTEGDYLGVDVLLFELLGRLVGEHRHPRHADDRDVRSASAHRRLAQRHGVVARRHHAAHVVETHRLEEHHGVVGPDRGLEHALGVFGCRRCDDEQPRDQPIDDLEAVRVLRRKLVARAARHANHHRHLGLAAKHVSDLRRVVHDLVVGDEREVDGHHLDDRAQTEHGRTDRRANNDLLGDRRVDDALGSELVEQTLGHAVGAAELADVLADQVNGIVALHLFGERFT